MVYVTPSSRILAFSP